MKVYQTPVEFTQSRQVQSCYEQRTTPGLFVSSGASRRAQDPLVLFPSRGFRSSTLPASKRTAACRSALPSTGPLAGGVGSYPRGLTYGTTYTYLPLRSAC